jgi:hypothetical protein
VLQLGGRHLVGRPEGVVAVLQLARWKTAGWGGVEEGEEGRVGVAWQLGRGLFLTENMKV